MDIKEVERKKRELEEKVLKLIQEFENETGCFVDDQGRIIYTARNVMQPEGEISIPVHIASK